VRVTMALLPMPSMFHHRVMPTSLFFTTLLD
jgi:hypothetical protein